MINASKFLVIIETFYQTIFKPSIYVLFTIYYGRGKSIQPQNVNDKIFFKSAAMIAQEIRNRKV